jgi:hypothetical protein
MPDKNSFWDKKRPEEESFASKEDVDKLDAKIDKLLKEEEEKNKPSISPARKMVGGISKGLGDIAKSLNTPNTGKRMRIGQMPDRKSPIARTHPHNPIAGIAAGMKRHHISDAPLD